MTDNHLICYMTSMCDKLSDNGFNSWYFSLGFHVHWGALSLLVKIGIVATIKKINIDLMEHNTNHTLFFCHLLVNRKSSTDWHGSLGSCKSQNNWIDANMRIKKYELSFVLY